MKTTTLKASLKILETERNKIAKSRDVLRDLLVEIESQVENADSGIEALDGAIDTLSELV